MTTIHARKKFLTTTVGAVIAGAAAPALLFLGAGNAHAIQDISETPVLPLVQDVSEGAPDMAAGTFDPQPDPAGILDPGSRVAIIDPGSTVGISDPEDKVGIGGPDTRPAP